MKILGISAYYHDSAAAIIDDGKIIAAAQEERFTRVKHDSRFPFHAISYCLDAAGIKLSEVDAISFYDKPFLKFERLLETYVAFAPKGFNSFRMSLPLWVKDKLFQKDVIAKELARIDGSKKYDILFTEHHQSHAASAFYPSPFEKAMVLTMDGVGEWATTSLAIGDGHSLEMVKEIHFPHSLGLLYSAFTYFTGFKVNSGEYKLMGLAPYGENKYSSIIEDNLIDIKDDGSFRLNQDYFDYCTGLKMTNDRFSKLFGIPRRESEQRIEQIHMDLAASIQAVTEKVVLKLIKTSTDSYDCKNICLAGGVALNCVANGRAVRTYPDINVWVQPASGDSGGALGAALAAYYHHFGKPRVVDKKDSMSGSYLGPQFDTKDIQRRLTECGAKFTTCSDDEMIDTAATALSSGKAIGWFQGRMEYGPRALGGRSILADPRDPVMQKNLNLKIKFRESFRPFAPSVLRSEVGEWFDVDMDSPYMLMVCDVKQNKRIALSEEQQKLFGIEKLNIPRSEVPAITHVDYSARIQTVEAERNPAYFKLISKFKEITGCPIVVNTSFNVRGEPIVCTPEDAFRCFMGCNLDMLVVGNCILEKSEQNPDLLADYKEKFELD